MPILSLARVVRDYFHPPPHRCLMIGLDAGGKTSLLYKLKLHEDVRTIPTVGFNVETVDFMKASFTIWDVGVRDKGRPLWRHYFQGMDILIFVIDSNDQERMEEASRELSWVVESDDLQNAVILIFASKQVCHLSNTEEFYLPTTEFNENRNEMNVVQPPRLDWLIYGIYMIHYINISFE
eukprot:TRINITY_DN5348_c0_g1_i6.p1 TRINITY_DN5348_c0_g1~~TRINITY_DN5348_c0_g1_i6.p1  ORF type:complete len:180 (+),score=25.79 TRINITY_DN5348_c0_g1_i6:70-609(+)